MDMIGNIKVAEVDFKAEAEDILFGLQETFGEEIPALFEDNMKSLAENYAGEQTEDVLRALGQEITLVHYLLYTIEAESDSYVLVLIAETEKEAFEQEMKALKRKAKLLLQPRKKPGSEAKRIDLGKRLPCQIYEMPENFRFKPQMPVDGLYVVDNLALRSEKDAESGLLSLDPEPHLVYKIPKMLDDLTGEAGCYAAIWHNPERGEDGTLQDKSSYIAVGKNLEDVAEWKVIHKDASCTWEVCFWYGEHLFLAGKSKAAVIKNAMTSGKSPEIVLESKENELTFPKLFQVKGQLYLYLQGKFYRWQKGGFLKREGFKTVVYTIQSKTIGKVIPVGEAEVAFIEKNFGIPRSSEIRMTEITLLNMETGAVRKLPCPVGNLAAAEEGKLLVLCTGHDVVKDKKKLPVLLCIDVRTGERLELPFGSMGTSELADAYRTVEGYVVLRTFSDNRVYYPKDLEGFMRGEKTGKGADTGRRIVTKRTAKRKTLPKDIEELITDNDIEKMKAVFEKCDINAYGGYSKGNLLSFKIPVELMKWLVEQGIDIEMPDQFAKTPLNSHAGGWHDEEQLRCLISLGAYVNTKDHMGRTPLHFAAETGNLVKVKELVTAGAELNATDVMGVTPLRAAVMRMGVHNMKNVAEVVEYLLSKGVSVDAKLQNEMKTAGEQIEFYRSSMSKEVQAEIAGPLAKLYQLLAVEPVSARELHDGKSLITVKEKTWQKQHDELWNLLVPGSGSASTVQGEVIRLSGRLSHEILDNGSCNWNEQYRQMADELKAYLCEGNILQETEVSELKAIFSHIQKGDGDEVMLARVAELSVAGVLKNPVPIPLDKKEE